MSVKIRYQDALKKLGLDCVEYRVEVEEPGDLLFPNGWTNCLATGVALRRNDKDARVIEHVPRGWGGDGKWRVFRERSRVIAIPRGDDDGAWMEHALDNDLAIGVAKTQREALAIAVESL